jgi:thiol-disulfide isomerase/thioredoxin
MLILLAALLIRPVTPTLVKDLAHGKPVVLHFFASWCGACEVEFPRIRKVLLEEHAVLISIDRPQDRDKAEAMLRKYRLQGLPAVLLDAPDPDPVAKAVGEPKWDGTLPSTFVFDASGKLVKSFIGRADPAAIRAAARRPEASRSR